MSEPGIIPVHQPDTTDGGGFPTPDPELDVNEEYYEKPPYTDPSEHNTQQEAEVDDTTKLSAPVLDATLDEAGSLVRLSGHGLNAGDQVVFSDYESAATVPAEGTPYYVLGGATLKPNSFQVDDVDPPTAAVTIAVTTGTTARVKVSVVQPYPDEPGTGIASQDGNVDTGSVNTLGLDPDDTETVADPEYGDWVRDLATDVETTDTTAGGGSDVDPTNTTDPEYRAPAPMFEPVETVDTAIPVGAAYSPSRAVTIADDTVALEDHGYAAGDRVVLTGPEEGQYVVSEDGLTEDAFTLEDGAGDPVTLTDGTAYVRSVPASTFYSGHQDMTQVGAVEDESAPDYDVPDAPTDVAAEGLENGEVQVTWTEPAQVTGAPRIGYYIESSTGLSVYAPGNVEEFNIQAWRVEADNQQDQTFTVRAVNRNGSGPKSDPSDPVDIVNINQGYAAGEFPGTDENPVYDDTGETEEGTGGQPTPPLNPVGTAGNTQVVVTWTAPAEGSPTGYLVRVHRNSDNVVAQSTEVDATPPLTATVTSLVNGTVYYATVIALDNVENSEPSAQSATFTPAP